MKNKIIKNGTGLRDVNEEKSKKTVGRKLMCRVLSAVFSFGFLGANMSLEANALNRTRKSNRAHSVVLKSKNKNINSRKHNSDIKKIKEQYEERLRQLEERVNELEERIGKLEVNLENADNQKKKSKKVSKKQKDENINDSDWTWPAPGYHHITSGFYDKENRSHVHGAIDIGGDKQNGSIHNASIVAANSGTVTVACTNGYGGGYGNFVVIDHGDKKSTLYGHLNSVCVSRGQTVSKGQQIGRAGSTGFSTGPHLHFEYRVDGVRTDPREILNY